MFEKVNGVWIQIVKLTASDGHEFQHFGQSVSIDGRVVVVGADWDDELGQYSGAAYVFEKVGMWWTEVAKLTASDGEGGDEFGKSIAVSGTTAVVGAMRDKDHGYSTGSAYVFLKIGGVWTQAAKLVASDGAEGDRFGRRVSVSGTTAAVGAPGLTNIGAAYVFDLNCSAPSLRALGKCPGRMGFEVTNATPNKQVAYLYAFGTGTIKIRNGKPCAGTTLDLNATAKLATIQRADADGTALFITKVPAVACARIYMQAIDISTCTTTNVVLVE